MGRLQRKDQAPRQVQERQFTYIETRTSETHERVQERQYDAQGRLRAERAGERVTTHYRPMPHLKGEPAINWESLTIVAGRVVGALVRTMVALITLLVALCITSLAYTMASWAGVGIALVLMALMVALGDR